MESTEWRKEKRRNFPHESPGLDFFCLFFDLSVLVLNIMQELWGAHGEKTVLVSPSEISENSCLYIYYICAFFSMGSSLSLPMRNLALCIWAECKTTPPGCEEAGWNAPAKMETWLLCSDSGLETVPSSAAARSFIDIHSSRTEQNAINYSASRCPACRFCYHHFKLSLIDSYRASYQLYLCIVDLQSL